MTPQNARDKPGYSDHRSRPLILFISASILIWINDTEVVGRSCEHEASQRNAKTRSVTPGVHKIGHSNAIAERQRRPGRRPLG
jgi:hypothetical protein